MRVSAYWVPVELIVSGSAKEELDLGAMELLVWPDWLMDGVK